MCFLIESHLLALCHSGSLKLSLNETCLNKALKCVLYLKVPEEVSSLLKHIEALLRAIFRSQAQRCKSAVAHSKSGVLS